ncbi:hypothetical protein QQF64_036449 [Cirrhinus molitorella]|uniref:Uncharacterized protein n=1 Tax=Cirrhinus molitorella TaxID=172907 RepID=A0ABR3NJ62_9TELE
MPLEGAQHTKTSGHHPKNGDRHLTTKNEILRPAPDLNREATAGTEHGENVHLDATGRNPGTNRDLRRIDRRGHGTRKPHQGAQGLTRGNPVKAPKAADCHAQEQPARETDESTHKDPTLIEPKLNQHQNKRPRHVTILKNC